MSRGRDAIAPCEHEKEKSMKEVLKTKHHSVDVCVVGGGIGGMFTAISAARRGAKVALMHDRHV